MTATDAERRMQDGYVHDEAGEEEVARLAAAAGPLAEAVRELIDAVVRSEVEPAELDDVRREVDRLTARLRARQLPGSFGVRLGSAGLRAWGNAVVGLRNATAPPLHIVQEPDGLVWAEADLGARFEGPPGLVHGGVSALLLDQMVGEAAAAVGAPGMTGTLTLRYLAGTPLGPVRLEARADRVEGVKTYVRGVLHAGAPDERRVCVEAESVMILPRWAREQLAGAEAASTDPTPGPRAPGATRADIRFETE